LAVCVIRSSYLLHASSIRNFHGHNHVSIIS
jgi:hypothetical protein